MFRTLLAIFALAIALPGSAAWYEATGQARIINDDVDTARAAAMREAVKNALVFAGASISSVQEVAGGVLMKDSFEVRSGGTVRDLRLINEKRSGNTLFVTVQADLFPANALCDDAKHRKTLMMFRFPITHRDQAREGDIAEIGAHLTQVVYEKFRDNSEYTYTRKWIDANVGLDLESYGGSDAQYEKAESLARHLSTQYLLTAEIRDLSMDGESLDKWRMWLQSPPKRFFEIEVILLDVLQNQVVLRKNYRTDGEWNVPRATTIDPRGRKFANSSYGQAIEKVLVAMQEDVDIALSCAPLLAQVIDIREDNVLLNVGLRNGFSVGDKLRIQQKQQMDRLNSGRHNRYVDTDIVLTVVEASGETLIARPESPHSLAGVQIYDLARHK